ncbi:spore germination protein GerW family protein [Rhodococcus sp. GA1]|uniref:spore germination protein GerW family protein n=1 Tax=Rhodococcus sp. GA1 TaxID=2942275 RepID=UPI0020CF44A5|nr:spore germination protein GerW family protein [Rhodococcus sp. GA1]
MKLAELMSIARDTVTVERVFSTPFEKDGVTVITAATITGGVGGGGGSSADGENGEGGGFGVGARPAGAYVVKDGKVSWRPAVDVNRLVRSVAGVVITFLIARAVVERGRAGRRR